MPRRVDSVETVGAALMAAVRGAGHRKIAETIGVPPSTVRDWLRRARTNAENIRYRSTIAALTLDELAAKIDPTGSRLGDAVEAVGRAVMAWNQRFDADPSATPWRVAAKVTVGHMLMPNPPRITFWPSG